jgi:hypothetical protein
LNNDNKVTNNKAANTPTPHTSVAILKGSSLRSSGAIQFKQKEQLLKIY